jgi:hypothetical protein
VSTSTLPFKNESFEVFWVGAEVRAGAPYCSNPTSPFRVLVRGERLGIDRGSLS